MTTQPNSMFLRSVLIADAAISGTAGLFLALAAAPLHQFLGISEALMRYAGVSLIPFAAVLVYLAARREVSQHSIAAIIALNIAWVVASVGSLFVIEPKPLGYGFVVIQALAVVAFAEMQYVGLRRSSTV